MVQRVCWSVHSFFREGESVVLETDKTGKFDVVSTERHLEMGAKHTKKDKVISSLQRGLRGLI